MLRAGELDIAVAYTYPTLDAPPGPDVTCTPLHDDPYSLVVHKDRHAARRRQRVPLATLAAEQWLSPRMGAGHTSAYDRLIEHYRQNVPYALGAAMALMGAMAIDDGRGLGETIGLRALRHVQHIDAFAVL